MTSTEISNFDALMRKRRYAGVIQGIPEDAEPALRALRAEAQAQFDNGLGELYAIYQRKRGSQPANPDQMKELRLLYDDQVGDLIDPQEAEAYARALIWRAEQALAAGDRNSALIALYAAQSLPIEQPTRNMIAQRLERANPAQPRATRELSPAEVDSMAAAIDPRPTVRLDKIDDHAQRGDADLDDDPAQAELELLEAMLRDQADIEQLRAQFARTQALLAPDAPASGRLAAAQKQLAALALVPRFRALLARPLGDWLSEQAALEQETRAILDQVEAAFSLDVALPRDLRTRREARIAEAKLLDLKLRGLPDLPDEALKEALTELEQQLPATFPALREAQQRRDRYLLGHQEAVARSEHELRRTAYRDLRGALDNALRAALPSASQLAELRERAARAADDASLGDDNPFDAQTLAYYDLVCADLDRRNLGEFADLMMAAQTIATTGELVQQLRYYRQALEVAKAAENPNAAAEAQKGFDATYQEIQDKLQHAARETIAQAEEQLARFEYAPALQNLRARLKDADDAEVEIEASPERLRTRLEALIAQALDQERKDQQVIALEQRAAAAAPPDGESPDFPQAIATLQQALGVAPQLDERVRQGIQGYRERQANYVRGLIRRADSARRGRDYPGAELLLSQALQTAFTDEQRDEIAARRKAIEQQRQNDENYQSLLAEISALSDAAREGEHIDRVAAQIVGERERIGLESDPKVDAERWPVLNAYLELASERVATWRMYREMLNLAEQAALIGDEPKMEETLGKLQSLVLRGGELSAGREARRIRQLARQSSQAARVRQLLDKLRQDLETDADSVSVKQLNNVLLMTEGMEDEADIASERAFLERLLPICRAREQLAALAESKQFAQLRQAYDQLPDNVRDHPTIGPFKQQADAALARQAFDEELRQLIGKVRFHFNRGWGRSSAELPATVGKLHDFAAAYRASHSEDHPRLRPATIEQLGLLADQLIDAWSDYEQGNYGGAKRRIELILQDIPINNYDDTNVLYSYSEDLRNLRQSLQAEVQNLGTDVSIADGLKIGYQKAVDDYLAFVRDTQHCFDQAKLREQMTIFQRIAYLPKKAEIEAYIATIEEIIGILRKVDAIEDLMIGRDQRPANSSGSLQERLAEARTARVQQVAQQLNEVLAASDRVLSRPEGRPWPGIEKDQNYQGLRANHMLAGELAAADVWLQYAEDMNRGIREIKLMGGAGAQLIKNLHLDPAREAALKNDYGLGRLAQACSERGSSIREQNEKARALVERRRRRDRRLTGLVIAGVIVALLAIAGWNVPKVRQSLIVAVVGTLTPIPTATALPTSASPASVAGPTRVVTATPEPTPTPTPLPTPVPPQHGVIVFPGSAFVRARPAIDSKAVATVTGGDQVLLTGFIDEQDGTRWYQLEIADRNLTKVWLPAQITLQKQPHNTVQVLDNGGVLNEQLRLPAP